MASRGHAIASIGQNIMNATLQKMQMDRQEKSDAIAGSKTEIDKRKADAAEEANRLKEQGLQNESVRQGYEAAIKSEDSAWTRSQEGLKSLTGLKDQYEGTIRDATSSPQQKAEAQKQLDAILPQHKSAMERMSKYATQEPLTFESYQNRLTEARVKAEQERVNKLTPPLLKKPAMPTTSSFYQSPAFNPASVTGESQSATKTVAYGGSPKKVEVVGGRVNSVVNPDGRKVAISGNIAESEIPTAFEFASKFGDMSSSPSASTSDAEAEAHAGDISIQREELPGYFKRKYVRSEPMQSISELATAPVSGTIAFDESTDSAGTKTRTPIIKFDDKSLVNVDGTPNEDAHKNLKIISLMHEAMLDGSHEDIHPTSEEIETARIKFGTKENAFDMPAIAKAYALVNRNVNQQPGQYDTNANYWGVRFEQKHKMFPSTFMANGEQVNDREITDSTSAILERTESARLAKRLEEIGENPEKPKGLDESIFNARKDMDDLRKEEEFLASELKRITPGTDYEKKLKSQQTALGFKLRVTEGQIQSANSLLANYSDSVKRYEASKNAVKDELGIDLAVQQLEAGRQNQAEKWAAASSRWIGTKASHKDEFNGYIASGLRDVAGRTTKIAILGKNGKPTGKFYEDVLDPAETVSALKKAHRYEDLISMSSEMPTKEMLDDKKMGPAITQSKLKDAIIPLTELKRFNDHYLNLQRQGFKGEAESFLQKFILPNADFAASKTGQKSLVGKLREAVVGPGNPSNYEQEVINSIVPDPTDVWTRADRNDSRIKALTVMAILDHMTKMQMNKLEPTDETWKKYNEQFGGIIGKKITPDMFKGIADDYQQSRTVYGNKQSSGQEDVSVAQQFAQRLQDAIDTRIAPIVRPKSK
jgi:hypothetical protein